MNIKEVLIFILMFTAWAIMSSIDFNSLVACDFYVVD